MARQVNGSAGHDAGKQGSGIGGGPVGSAGGYSGRPSGTPKPNAGNPGGHSTAPGGVTENNERMGGTGSRSAGGLLAAGLLSLLLGKKPAGNGNNGNGNNSGCLGRIIRIAVLVIIVVFVLKSCGILGTGSNSVVSLPSAGNSSQTTVYSTPAPATPTPVVHTPSPTRTPAPTAQPVESSGWYTNGNNYTGSYSNNSYYSTNPYSSTDYGSTGAYSGLDLSSLFGGHSSINGSSYSTSGWTNGSNCGRLDTTVAPGSRNKFTSIKGNGNDTVTIMLYMCGTDLESNYGMATSDLSEIAKASIADNVNIIVYTGGCTGWQNNLMSNKTNQIYKIEAGGKFRCLNDSVGNKAMVTPTTLTEFIQFCSRYFPANRNMLIFWDHGGGSVSGYGYDQRFKSSGSMTLDGIDKALSEGGVYFDVIGFDACLMATVETADVCAKYADYLIASEESEPGYGWYYTNWVNMLSGNTSVSTLELGRRIVDDFVDVSAKQCAGQDTTLSLTDLAEFENTVPAALNSWSDSTASLVQSDYKSISSARAGSKEFASSSKIDQVDLAHVAFNLGTNESKALANALLGAVKYNRTASTVKNAYGLSIYFPYRNLSYLKTAVSTYNKIGLDDNYSRCIQTYAKYAQSGQASSYSNGYSSAFGSLFDVLGGGSSDYSGYGSGYGSSSGYGGSYGSGYGSSSGYGGNYGSGYGSSSGYGNSYSSSYSTDELYSMLSSLLGMRSIGGVEDSVDVRSVADYVGQNTFDASALVWERADDGKLRISLPDDQWNLINEVKLSLFLDDGEGFIDYGLDLYDGYFDEEGNLIGEFDTAWLTINDWTVAYYQLYTVVEKDGTVITLGRVPCIYNGARANLLIEIANDVPNVVGVCYDYMNGNMETETAAKVVTDYSSSDTVTFVADYYDYENNYQNSYAVSDTFKVGSGLSAEYKYISGDCTPNACYRLTDIYAQDYWTPVMENAA